MLNRVTRPGACPHMKNFGRLLRFTWPYRVRFGLSFGCAIMVAILWGANISLVYPLLKVLFYSQNCQTWIAEQINMNESDAACLKARLEELGTITQLLAEQPEVLAEHFQNARTTEDEALKQYRDIERVFGNVNFIEANPGPQPRDPKQIEARRKELLQIAENRRRELTVSESRVDELKRSGKPPVGRRRETLAERETTLKHDLANTSKLLGWYRWAEPRISTYLPHDGFRTLLLLMGVVFAGVALKCMFMFFQEVLVADVNQLSLFNVRNHFFRRTMALDLNQFGQQNSAELIARFTSDMESLSQGFNTLLGRVIREPLRAVACLGIAFWLNWRLTCLTLVLVPVSAYTANRAGKTMKRAMRKSLESTANIYKILQETLQGVAVVKAYTTERRERRRFFLETKSLYKKSLKVATIDALSDPVLEILSLATVSIALLAGAYLVLRRTIFLDLGLFRLQLASSVPSIEDLLSLYATLGGISDPVRKLSNVHSKLQRAAAASDRICALMDREPEVTVPSNALRIPRHQRTIEFDHVSFSYNDRDPVLRDLTLSVKHGETIALVGPNGCGKSTLMSLLPRFFDVASGTIRIDGIDIKEVQLRSLRSQIGVVIQETILFEDTVANNIAYGSQHTSRDHIIAASKRSYAHQFISNLPDGYDTMLGARGAGLSGGQRQRIALARAMLRDPAILILDEATSAVDIQDEALIRKAIEEFSRGRTTFLITHSLGSLQFADRIVLMNAGRIEAVGTDSELRKSSPLYRKLHEIHFQRESA